MFERVLATFKKGAKVSLMGLLIPGAALALDWNAKDVEGSKDHPLIHRFNGSWLVGYQHIGFDMAAFPSKIGLVGMNELDTPIKVDGEITRLLYLAPPGKRPYEVQKNYLSALKAAGYQESVSCSGEDECQSTSYGLSPGMEELTLLDFDDAVDANPALTDILHGVDNGGNIFGEHGKYQQMSVGTLSAGGKTAHLVITSDKHYSADIAITYVQIVQPEDMPLGQVSVDLNGLKTSDAISSSLKEQGKVALYGVHFDSGKSEIKPDSKLQLDEMAKYLKGNPDKKVFVVGHTDNQGDFSLNLKLAQDRAKAVVTTLINQYQISAGRLNAQGVANLAPVGSNGTDEGRAQNRRVELVEQ